MQGGPTSESWFSEGSHENLYYIRNFKLSINFSLRFSSSVDIRIDSVIPCSFDFLEEWIFFLSPISDCLNYIFRIDK